MSVKIGTTDFTEFNDLYNDPNIIPPAERAKIDFEVALIGKIIDDKIAKGIS